MSDGSGAIPEWFTTISIAMLLLGGICSLILIVDLIRHPQHMWIMNVVWPVTALFGTVFSIWGYYKYGWLASRQNVMEAKQHGEDPPNKRLTPFWMMVAKGSAHCGSGCSIGDVIVEFAALFFPVIATIAGWKWLFPPTEHGKMFAVWVLDFAAAFFIGIAFQYFTIVPMRGLSVGRGIVEAVKADTLSLISWQLGMYGFMAIAQLYFFSHVWKERIDPGMPEFWFVMQIAMMAGFVTSYPVNWLLLKNGIKEKM